MLTDGHQTCQSNRQVGYMQLVLGLSTISGDGALPVQC